jgi:hypothetical protein
LIGEIVLSLLTIDQMRRALKVLLDLLENSVSQIGSVREFEEGHHAFLQLACAFLLGLYFFQLKIKVLACLVDLLEDQDSLQANQIFSQRL